MGREQKVSEEELFNRPLTAEQKQEVLALMDRGDEDIDLSDIPEVDFSKAVRGLFYRGPNIRLNEDLRKYFADLAFRKRVPMNDLVNETLAKALAVVEVAK